MGGSSLRRIVALSVFAFVVYGAWAAFANREHGVPIALRSFGVQGCSSAISTAGISGVVELLWRWLGGARWAVFPAAIAGTLVAACMHTTFHVLARTPNILAAISLPTFMGLVFGLAYAVALARRTR